MRRIVMTALATAIASAALLSSAPAPAQASGHLWYFNGAWVHQHTRNFGVYPQFQEAGWNLYADLARGFWDAYTILNVYRTTNHDSSRIHEIEDYYGLTGWAGLAQTTGGYDPATGHYPHGHALYNHTYNTQVFQATACQEQGHLLGLDHANNGGCMAAGYYPLWAPYPQQDDYDRINSAYPAWGH